MMVSLSLALVLVGVDGVSTGVVDLPRRPREEGEAGVGEAPLLRSCSAVGLSVAVCPLLTAVGVVWTHLFFEGGGVRGGGDRADCLSLIFLLITKQLFIY